VLFSTGDHCFSCHLPPGVLAHAAYVVPVVPGGDWESLVGRCGASTLRGPCSLSVAEQEILALFHRLTASVSPLASTPPSHLGISSK